MRRSFIAMALAAARAPALSASAQQQTWVAVASDGAGLWGIGVGMETREGAEQMAMGECGVYCRIKFTSQARCVSYAFSPTGRAEGFAAGANREQVGQQAYAECNANVPANSCRIETARCFE